MSRKDNELEPPPRDPNPQQTMSFLSRILTLFGRPPRDQYGRLIEDP